MITAAEPFTAMPLQWVPSLLTTLHRLRLRLSGLHWLIRRDARQKHYPTLRSGT